MKIVKIVNMETGAVSERDYKTIELAQDAASRKSKNEKVGFNVQVFKLENPEIFPGARITKTEQYFAKVRKNKAYRAAVKEYREIAKWERYNTMFEKAVEREAIKKEKAVKKAADAEYRMAVKESNEVKKWEGYTEKANAAEAAEKIA